MEYIRQIRDDSPKHKPMKSVIVSQWTRMLDVVEYHLKQVSGHCMFLLLCCKLKISQI